ncbi:MAG: hypothetical protein US31_C0009G0024 [Berkelbacteria bacterium GW2011_GWA1_36_9]|uniref:Uncharacterized protein n=1 Tax=Berkelbacteria bacterium GW2011_GWA1_36_9 TaxID=1618331 RepID=A0A0G0FWC1_9BACT|nr:MAG: hypothetical protein US31_C0009G0024 [Berkelbacteria bacterium GW2011_GWA1_36_9]
MKFRKLFIIGLLFSSILLALFLVFKPALAMAPPPASHFWLFLWGNNNTTGASTAVTVKVEWKEGIRTENVTIKTFLK